MSAGVRTAGLVTAGLALVVGLSGIGASLAAFSATTANTVNSFAAANSFGLTQLASPDGCVSEDGTGGACTDGTALLGTSGVAVSPDGDHVYTAADVSDAVTLFARDSTTGALTQLGCISETGTGGACTDGTALVGAIGVAVSPDGAHVYTVSHTSSAVGVFARDTTTGALTQTGCISEDGTGGACTDGTALLGTSGVAVSPDGANVYVTTGVSSAVAGFARDATTGALTQAGCVSDDGTGGACTDGTALDGTEWVAVSPDGDHVYVGSDESDAVASFARDATTGALRQLSGTSGCVSHDGSGGACTNGTALDGVRGLAVSPDGADVYAVANMSNAVVVFNRAR